MSPPRRRCLAQGCSQGRRKGQPFCRSHWSLLNALIQTGVAEADLADFKRGGRTAVRGAVAALAAWEGRPC